MTPDGILNIYKDENITSHDITVHVRRLLGVRRVGHTGTLDPMATGVLPVCVGRSARVMEYLDTDLKKYRCVMKLGRSTNTYDIWGETVEEASEDEVNKITEPMVRDVLSAFTGRLLQTPPLYSAVKVKGKRLYEYARKGREVDIPKREVYITSLEIEDMSLGLGHESWVRFSCECTKGTFIRSICHDAGEKLGVHACMSELTRTASGIFTEETAITLDQLREKLGYTRETEPRRGGAGRSSIEGEPEDITGILDLRAPDEALRIFGSVVMEPKDAMRLINGLEIERSVYRVLEEPEFSKNDFYFPVREEYKRLYRIYSPLTPDMEIPGRPDGAVWYPERTIGQDKGLRFIGLGLMNPENGHLWPEKIFI